MSNAFPSMISNEPPPLDQSDEEDEDSEDLRDFTSGLKVDVDPSPISTPRKVADESVQATIPVNPPCDSKIDLNNENLVSNEVPDTIQSADRVPVTSSLPEPILTNSVMKTSYIGTVSPDPDPPEEINGIDDVDFGEFEQFATRSEIVCETSVPENPGQSQYFPETNHSYSDDDEFDSFQDCEVPKTVPVEEYQGWKSSTEQNGQETDTQLFTAVTNSTEESNKRNSDPSACIELFEDVPSFESSTVVPAGKFEYEKENELKAVGEVNGTPEGGLFQAAFSSFPPPTLGDDDFDEFDDFQDFESSSKPNIPATSNPVDNIPVKIGSAVELEDNNFVVHDSQGCETEKKNDLFSATDFEPESNLKQDKCNIALDTAALDTTIPTGVASDNNDDFDDFDDFQAFQCPTSSSPSKAAPVKEEFTFALPTDTTSEHKLESLVKSLFVVNPGEQVPATSVLNPIDKELKANEGDQQWNQVEDFEGSQGLLFKWLNSVAYHRFLQSLKIDKSTIVYSEKWGAIEVPRFAASLVDSPLQPETGSKVADGVMTKDVSPSRLLGCEQNYSAGGDDIKRAVGTTDVAGCSKSERGNNGYVSREAEQILNQLPDLSFMRAKNLVFPRSTPSHVRF